MPEFADTAEFEDVRMIRATSLAVLVEIDGAEHWIPESQIDDDSEIWSGSTPGETVHVVVQNTQDKNGEGN